MNKCYNPGPRMKSANEWADPEEGGKSQVPIGILRNSGTDPLDKQFDPLGSNASTYARPSVRIPL